MKKNFLKNHVWAPIVAIIIDRRLDCWYLQARQRACHGAFHQPFNLPIREIFCYSNFQISKQLFSSSFFRFQLDFSMKGGLKPSKKISTCSRGLLLMGCEPQVLQALPPWFRGNIVRTQECISSEKNLGGGITDSLMIMIIITLALQWEERRNRSWPQILFKMKV